MVFSKTCMTIPVSVHSITSFSEPALNVKLKFPQIAACVGGALVLSMIISSLLGTLIPMFLHKLHVDPAVASGPLITTTNDLIAAVTYYGLAWILLINVLHIG